MSETRMGDVPLKSDDGQKFDRGSALSIFRSDRREDLVALGCALLIALAVYLGLV